MDHYKPSLSKEVQIAEKELNAEIQELKNALSENKVYSNETHSGKEKGGKLAYLNE